MLSTTVVAIAATVPAGAEIVVLDESSDGSTDAIAEPWPEVQVRRRCHTSVSSAPATPGRGHEPASSSCSATRTSRPSPGWLELLADANRSPSAGADAQADDL